MVFEKAMLLSAEGVNETLQKQYYIVIERNYYLS